jgi:putative transposase
MARPIRINFQGAYYHVINRGRGRTNIFRDDRDRKTFLQLLGECHDQYQVPVIAYCLMSNHYHLLLCTPHANLPTFMRQLNGVYTQLFNRRNRTDGSLFRGRYKAIVVQEELYLLSVIRYIHLNPKKAGIVKDLKDFVWSSHRTYVKSEKPQRWLNYKNWINQEWTGGKRGVRGYELFMKKDNDQEIEDFYNAKKIKAILGKVDYQDHLAQSYIDSKRFYNREIPQERKIQQKRLAQRVEALVCQKYAIKDKGLREARRGEDNEARKVAMRLLREQVGMTCKEIAQRYGVGNERSISEYCRRIKVGCLTDQNLLRRYERLRVASLQVET